MIKLYHGTDKSRLQSILANGIQPRQDEGNWGHTVISRPNMVYLTDSYAFHFSMHCMSDDDFKPGSDYPAVAIEVWVDEDKLYPDEDWMAQSVMQYCKQNSIPMNRTLCELTDEQEPLAHKDLWQFSLEKLGTVAHYGTIPKEQISRIALIWDWKFLLAAFDQQVSLIAYHVLKERHRLFMRMAFDEIYEVTDPITGSIYKIDRTKMEVINVGD